MKKDLTTTENKNELMPGIGGAIYKYESDEESFGAGSKIAESNIFDDEIIIPKLRLQQALSKTHKHCQIGEFVNSQSGQLYGPTVQFVVIDVVKMWQTDKIVNGKKKYASREKVTPENHHTAPGGYQFQFTEAGEDYTRKYGLYYTVALVDDLKEGRKIPLILDFWSSSRRAGGKNLTTYIKRLEDNKSPSSAAIFELSSELQNFEDGDAFVKQVKPVSASQVEYIQMAKKMYMEIQKAGDRVKYDDSDVVETSHTEQPTHDDIPF